MSHVSEEVGHVSISHMAMECVAYNVYVGLLTFNLFLDFSVVLSSKLTSLSSNLQHYKLLWEMAADLS